MSYGSIYHMIDTCTSALILESSTGLQIKFRGLKPITGKILSRHSSMLCMSIMNLKLVEFVWLFHEHLASSTRWFGTCFHLVVYCQSEEVSISCFGSLPGLHQHQAHSYKTVQRTLLHM